MCLDSWRALDPLEEPTTPTDPPDVPALQRVGVTQVMLHPGELAGRAELARMALVAAGWSRQAADADQELWIAPR